MSTSKPRRLRSFADSRLMQRAELAEHDELEEARKRVGRRRPGSAKPSTAKVGATKVHAPTDGITAAVTFFVGACVCTFLFFENPYLAPFETWRLVNATVLLWIPCMVVLLCFKQDLQHFGMTRGDRKFGLKFTLIAILAMLAPLIVISLQQNFKQYYGNSLAQDLAMVGYAARPDAIPIVRPIGLLYYELGQGFYFFCWEFFFRGFLLFGLARARYIGATGAVILQAIPFTLLHWSIVPSAAKPLAEIATAAIGGPILGWLAVRTKTFFYGFLIHWAIAAILDFLLVGSLLIHTR